MSPHPASAGCLRHTLSHLSHPFQCTFAFPFQGRPCGAFPCRKRVQRYDLFPNRQIFFSLFFRDFSHPAVPQPIVFETFFHPRPEGRGKSPAKRPGFPRFSRKSASLRTDFSRNPCNLLVSFCLIHAKIGLLFFIALVYSLLSMHGGRGLTRPSPAPPTPLRVRLPAACTALPPPTLREPCGKCSGNGRRRADQERTRAATGAMQ